MTPGIIRIRQDRVEVAGRRRSTLLLATAVMASVSATSTQAATPTPNPSPTPLPGLTIFALEPPPEALLEAVPKDETARLLAKTQQSVNFCGVMSLLSNLREPLPDRVNKLLVYAQRYHQVSSLLDPASKLEDPDSRVRKRILPPPDILEDMAIERAAMYAYSQRLSDIRLISDQQELNKYGEKSRPRMKLTAISPTDTRRRLRFAFSQLVNSGYTRADARLVQSRVRFCKDAE